VDIDVTLGAEILDLVGPCLQLSIFEDGRGVVGRSWGHGQNKVTSLIGDRQ